MSNLFLFVTLLLLTLSSYAGDMNLICEDKDGELMVSDTIKDSMAKVSFEDESQIGEKQFYTVSLISEGERNSYQVTFESLGEKKTYLVLTRDYRQMIPISKNIYCYQND